MGIEFICTECGKRIGVSDDTLTEIDRCPTCGGAVEVARVPPPGKSHQTFAGLSQPRPSGGSGSDLSSNISMPQSQQAPLLPDGASLPENPYAPPVIVEMTVAEHPAAKKEIRHSTFSVRQLFSHTWAVFSDQLPICVMISIALSGFVVPAGIGTVILSEMALRDTDDVLPVIIPLGLAAFTVYCWLLLGQAILMIKLCRGDRAKLGDLFSGGPYLWRGIGLTLLVGLIEIGVSVACILPAMVIREPVAEIACQIIANVANYIIGLFLVLSVYLIVDRDVGVFQSIAQSARCMTGNKLTLFLAHLIVGIGCLASIVLTCSLSIIFVVPYCMLFSAMVYVLATGQPTAVDRSAAMLARIRR